LAPSDVKLREALSELDSDLHAASLDNSLGRTQLAGDSNLRASDELFASETCANPTSSSAPVSKPSRVPTPTAKTSTAPAAPNVLLDKTGSGTSKTAIFITPSEWEIDYSFDCTGFGYKGNFQIYVYDGTGALKDIQANALALKGSDVIYEHNLSGPYYLQMNSECDWHVIVKG